MKNDIKGLQVEGESVEEPKQVKDETKRHFMTQFQGKKQHNIESG